MMTVGEHRHAELVEKHLSRIANSLELLVKCLHLEQLVKCLETLEDKDEEEDENERD